jgi:lipopolysaccharide/colanic/teichoic acid biosynthesis glycosyltransferase
MKLAVNDLVQAQLGHRVPAFTSEHPRWARILGQLVPMRFQVVVGLAATLLLPILFVRGPSALADWKTYADPGVAGNVMAFLLGFYVFRRVAAFPGVQATSPIIPAFATAYGLTAIFYFALRLTYHVVEFAVSFLIAVFFFYMICFVMRRVRRIGMTVVSGGRAELLLELTSVDWHLVDTPDQADLVMPIVVDLSADLSDDWERYIANCALEGRPVYNFKQLHESMTGRTQVAHISENSFGVLAPNEIWGSAKRYVDVLAAATALVAGCWFMLILALLIRLDSKGPAIFRQKRIGYRGNAFTMYKFRTMRVLTPEQEAGNTHFHDADRITRLGALLRRSRLDELPQLVNILKGDMSWIGPRPEALSLSAQYEANLPFYRYRHVVRPGITGWAQVNQGHVVGIADANYKLQFDFFYIHNFSLWLDLLVVLRTFRVILTGSGAR